MLKEDILKIIDKQREFFLSGYTLDVKNRIKALKSLYSAISEHKGELRDALKKDLGKSYIESDMCEILLTLSEISYQLKHIKKFSKIKRVKTPLANYASTSLIVPSPYGNTLIMSPWNYPVLLTLEPLADALASGNTALIKPSAYAPNVSKALLNTIKSAFNEEYVSVVEGGREENSFLLREKFDYIFFTGSKTVGREVMRYASEHLTPVTLELGGKSPTLIEKDANIELAAKRIVFGKYLNVGQTCVAPDYILIDKSIKKRFIEAVKREILRQFGNNPLSNEDYGKMISEKHFRRVLSLIDSNKVVYGGKSDEKSLKIEPTVMDNVAYSDKVMSEEIFGPIMPIIEYENVEDALKYIISEPHPLAFYIFTSDKKGAIKIIKRLGFGGGCINDTIVHLATSEMAFGGFGQSGMGSYHGKAGFDTFTHYKSILDKKNYIDLPIRYQPYSNIKLKLIEKFLK